jgi:hypothetical protein
MVAFDFMQWLPYIREKLPQVNEQTEIRHTNNHKVCISILDPIKIRGAYNEPILTRKGAFWRIVGALFNRKDWSAKGWLFNPPVYIREREIEMKSFVVRGHYPHAYSRVVIGYDPVTDTLFVNPKHTVWMEPTASWA